MSRSYRKNVVLKDKNKFAKKYANRVARRKMNNKNYFNNTTAEYKKLYESWNISDFAVGYRNLHTWMKHQREFYDSDEECIRDYNRWWKSK